MPRLDHIHYNDSILGYQSLLDIIYPIDSILLTVGSNSPAQTLGGTWVEILDGLMGCCGSGTYFPGRGNAEWQGSWTISLNQMPAHRHNMYTNASISTVVDIPRRSDYLNKAKYSDIFQWTGDTDISGQILTSFGTYTGGGKDSYLIPAASTFGDVLLSIGGGF